jgi:hypothetical protein
VRRLLGAFAALILLAAGLAPAAAQSGLDRLDALDLPQITGRITLDHSEAASEIAGAYFPEIDAAARWFEDMLGWTGPVRVAVLTAEDYARVGTIPYPSPYTETRTGLIVIADDVSTHPGFELWDLDAFELNAAWAFHELGHKIARDLGIWSPSYFVNELIANVFMAAYVRAERPIFAGFQSGMPPRFASAGTITRLEDFDRVYFGMGQANYLWFHFHLAAMADFIVTDEDFPAIVARLQGEFPLVQPRAETLAQSFARLERVKPGVTALTAPLL